MSNQTFSCHEISFSSDPPIPFFMRADAPEGYVSDKAQGEYDEILECIISVEGICETEYVEEVLELCRDCDIPTPDIKPPSGLKVWATQWGISLFYAMNDAKNWISKKVFGDPEKEHLRKAS